MAFAMKRDDPKKKVDLRRLEKVLFDSERPDTVDILTKPIDFRPADAQLDKETILIDQINSSKITQLKLMEEDKKSWLEKDPHEGVLMELCSCDNCLKYRESVIHFYVEECEYNILWIRLQQIIERHYELIDDNPACVKKYRELMCPTKTKWLSDGQADNKKNIQISLASNLPLNNDMTLILIFNMLHSRDPHQLFELLCMQVKAISVAYFENLKDMCQPKLDGSGQEILGDINNFVSHGASEIQVGALKLEPLMAEYLKPFKLSWVFVCEHIYHRWVTTEVISLLRTNPTEIPSFPFFSIDFVESVLEWPKHWKLLETFYSSPAEVARRKRIFEGQRLLRKIKGTPLFDKSELLLDEEPTKENDWKGILIHIRTLWQESVRAQEMNPKANRCRTCDNLIQVLRHAWDCDCRICAVMGGLFPFLGGWQFQDNLTDCTRCYRALQLASRVLSVEKKDFTYHLSWAVFKHLPGRLEYIISDLQLPHICVWSSCTRIECLVAQSIILGHYPKEMAKYLVGNYHQVEENLRFQIQPQTSVRNIFVTLNEERQLTTNVLLSLLAEVNVLRGLPAGKEVFGELLNKYLKATGKDVQLDLSAYPENDRSDFMGNGASYPEDVVDVICEVVNPVHERGVNDFQMLLRAKRVTENTTDVLDEMISRYMAFIHYCRYFVENDFVTGGGGPAAADIHHQAHRKGSTGRAAARKKAKGGGDGHGHSHGHSHHHHHHHGAEEQHSECCSLFGHGAGEWQRSRSTETRERLRKKLQMFAAQQQQQNGNGAGAVGGGEVSGKSKSIQRKTIDKNHHEGHNKGFYKTLENVLMKIPQMNLPHRSRQLPELDQLNLKDLLERAGGDFPRDPNSPPGTPATPDSIAEELLRVQCKVEELQERIGNISLDAMVDYIEGNRSKPKGLPSGAGGSCGSDGETEKKLAKKLRQKLKKHEQRRLEMLEELKGIYHEQVAFEGQLKGQVRELRGVPGKKRDKKRIVDAETEMKKAAKVASKTESMICEIICDLRETNPDFKFNYQPPKEVAPIAAAAAKEKQGKTAQRAPSLQPKNVMTVTPSSLASGASLINGGNDNAFQQFVAMQQRQGLPQFKAPAPAATAAVDEGDPAKRMVTIRRVNLPHAEAQVTVMAKGDAPGQDRLLYSFINGQMVPASSLVPSLGSGLNPPANAVADKQQKQPPKQQTKAQQQSKAAPPPPPKIKTKTEIKKEKKAQKLREAEVKRLKEEKEQEEIERERVLQEEESNRRQKGSKKGDHVDHQQKGARGNKQPQALHKNRKEAEPVVKQKKVRKEPRVEYLDPSFNKNKFNLLLMNSDDEDVGYSESEEEEDAEVESEEEVPVASTPPPPPPPSSTAKGKKEITAKNHEKQGIAKKQEAQKKDPRKETAPAPVQQPIFDPQLAGLTKNQRKKLLRANKLQTQEPASHPSSSASAAAPEEDHVERAVKRAEKMAESLTTEMNKLNLNADTTIELINPFMKPLPNPFLTGNGEQLTEQLNRGVNVGGLQLPPGITLTKLDPARAKEYQRKKEAINALSQPLANNLTGSQQAQQQKNKQQEPQVIMANPTMQMNGGMYGGGVQSEIVVIETPELSKKATGKSAAPANNNKKGGSKPPQPQAKGTANQNQQGPKAAAAAASGANIDRTNKNSKNKENQRQQIQQKILASRNKHQQQQDKKGGNAATDPNQMVTLRNPMFHNSAGTATAAAAAPSPSAATIAQQNAIRLRSSTGQVMDTPAAIIQNENGMFTIRNPALHQAYAHSGHAGSSSSSSPPVGGGGVFRTEQAAKQPVKPIQTIPIDVAASQAWKAPGAGAVGAKAIGSEMKQARQEAWHHSAGNRQPQQQQFNNFHSTNDQQPRSYSPFDSQLNLGSSYATGGGGGGTGAGGMNGHNPVVGSTAQPPPGYLANAGFSAYVSASDHQHHHGHHGGGGGGAGSCSGGDPNHQCEDPHPSSLVNDQKYFRESPLMSMMNQNPYGDFIQHLQPGQRLNSEVTIHNINESKFLGNSQHQQAPISNHVEITRIPAGGRSGARGGGGEKPNCDKLAVGSERRNLQQAAEGGIRNGMHRSMGMEGMSSTHGRGNVESVFEPNQVLNLNDLPSDERDIESFKRFNYFFEPPKSKMKVNLNVQDIYSSRNQDSPSAMGNNSNASPRMWDQQ